MSHMCAKLYSCCNWHRATIGLDYMVNDSVKILYGTTNRAKLCAMRKALKNFNFSIIGLHDIKSHVPQINECGKTPLENAEIKAKAYYEAFKIPVFSCDSAFTLMN